MSLAEIIRDFVTFSLEMPDECQVPSVEEKAPRFAEKVRAGVARLGTGEAASVEVKLRDKTALKGYISEATEDYFTVVDEAGRAIQVTYPQVKGVKGQNLSEGARIAIVAWILAAVIVIALAAAGGARAG